MRNAIKQAAMGLLLTAVCGGASCVSDGGGYDNGRDTGGYGNNDYDRPGRIPRRADVVREGDGKLRWRADLDGVVYVYDREKDVIRFSGPVRRGQDVTVLPDDDRILIDGRVVADQNLERRDTHQIYFVAGDQYDRNDRPAQRQDDRRSTLPPNAQRVDRGRGVIGLSKAPRAGVIVVYDEDAKAVVYRADVGRGDEVRVVPREGKIYVDGKLDRARFVAGHTLSLYYAER